ncbi:MAG: HesA/MoeB/ThiF family protein [Thermodesulfobacteriota bacterium]|nr:HesA/MoeB/ThiF family protein [Thermodesulfobacteriota bacterium]MDY7077741.1 HesA/MoeB/ThiF family protein [Chloroflexota bacterium]
MRAGESLEEFLSGRSIVKSKSSGEKAGVLTLAATAEISSDFDLSRREVEIASLSQGIIPDRYLRNSSLLSLNEQKRLLESKVLLVGLGGLGGTIAELLARVGIGRLVVADGDQFEENNLNRQILSSEKVLGESKTKVAFERLTEINSAIHIDPIDRYLGEGDLDVILNGVDVAVDALDNFSDRFLLERKCSQYDIPLVHGAVGGAWGQVSVIYPRDPGLRLIYGEEHDLPETGIEAILGNLSPTVGAVASIQVMEVIKVLTGKGVPLRNRIIFLDLMEGQIEVANIMDGEHDR